MNGEHVEEQLEALAKRHEAEAAEARALLADASKLSPESRKALQQWIYRMQAR